MFNDPVGLTGKLTICRYDENNNLVETVNVNNLVVTTGKTLLANLASGNTTSYVGYMGVGTSSTAASASDTTLVSESGRVGLTTRTTSSNVISFVAIFLPGTATATLQEAGLFTASSGGIMFARSTFSPITKGMNDTVAITWAVTVG